jgi:Tfp pilus assembly protein PilX
MFTSLKKQFKKLKKENKSKGIALVIAITVMTLLLSISFSISNIVLRQIRITNINNASKPAFFVADSAIECAFYYDIASTSDIVTGLNINADFSTAIFGQSPESVPNTLVKCGNKAPLGLKKDTTSVPNTVITTFDVDYGNMCAKVEVTRTEVATKITSRGYNTRAIATGCDLADIDKRRLVERGLTITY